MEKKEEKTKQKIQHCWAAYLIGLNVVLQKLEMEELGGFGKVGSKTVACTFLR